MKSHQKARVIRNRHDAAIKQFRQLQHRSERERTGKFVIEGMRFVAHAIEQAFAIETVLYSPPLLTHCFAKGLVKRLRKEGLPCIDAPADIFQSVSLSQEPQGIAVISRQRWEVLDAIDPSNDSCWIVLESVQSPGNLGTILRTGAAIGNAGLILIGDAIDPYDPATVRATMGAVFCQRYVRASWTEFLAWKEQHGCALTGTSPTGKQTFDEIAYRAPTLLFIGSERKGLSAEQQRHCDNVVRIPMTGHVDSLNVAVATGILLYEIYRGSRRTPVAVPDDAFKS